MKADELAQDSKLICEAERNLTADCCCEIWECVGVGYGTGQLTVENSAARALSVSLEQDAKLSVWTVGGM